jgi:two-component system, sensor histidine kinase and response regulator
LPGAYGIDVRRSGSGAAVRAGDFLRRAEPPPEAGMTAPEALRAGQILLAEDNDINALLARTLLEAAGYRVTRVGDGAKAVQAVREWAFDLVLMDVQMPALDGLQATRLIRVLDGPAARVPIVALTANAMRTDRDACLAAGMDEFITKPIVAESFLEMVARYVALGGVRPGAAAGAEAPADEAILDRGPLERLARLMGPQEFEAMAREHLKHMEDLLARMDERAAGADLAGLGADAHACRGSWAEFGGQQVQDLAKRLETACRDGDRDWAMRLVGEVRRACEAAAGRLAAELAARPGQRRAV